MKRICLLMTSLVVASLLFAGCEAGNTPLPLPREGQIIPFQKEYRGQQGPFPDHGYLVVQRPEVWEALWGNQQVPTVDFARQTALVALMGRQPTAGYEIRITEVRDTGQSTNVYVQQTLPAAGAVVAQVITYPYHIVVVPRVTQPVYFVPVDGAATPPITILDTFQGLQSNATAPQTAVIREQLAWTRFWTETFGAAVAAPEVDFGRNMAVAVLMGTKPTGGYAVRITSVDRVNQPTDRLVVNYRTRVPQPGEVVTQALTAPFSIAIIPASPLPVTFNNLTPPPAPAAAPPAT